MSHPQTDKQRCGIMRTEVIVICCLIVLMACLIVPLVSRWKTRSNQTIVKDRLRNIGVQFQVYHDRYRTFPVISSPAPVKKPLAKSDTSEDKLP